VIRTHNPSKRAAADLRLRKRGHWDWLSRQLATVILIISASIFVFVVMFALCTIHPKEKPGQISNVIRTLHVMVIAVGEWILWRKANWSVAIYMFCYGEVYR